MHWSKSRHVDYEACPRKFFYSEIAAPRNPDIGRLAEQTSPQLVRHEVVRMAISGILRKDNWDHSDLPSVLDGCETHLVTTLKDTQKAAAEHSIVTACISGFSKDVLPDIQDGKIVHITDGNPIEFMYDGLTMFVHPELAVDFGDRIEIFNWRSGSSGWHREEEFRLKAGGLTCWARAILKELTRPIVICDYYLRDLSAYRVTLGDEEIREFVARAKQASKRYSVSARIADFPSRADWSNCRWCNFKIICPEYEIFAEVDYGIPTLNESLAAAAETREDALLQAQGEFRSVFLSHVSEDKDDIVRPFSRALEVAGIPFWLDEAEMKWGTSLTRGINKGLATSDFLIPFISKRFIERGWPEAELGSALTAQLSDGRVRLLPIFVADREAVLKEYPVLSTFIYKDWNVGIEQLVKDLRTIVGNPL